MPVDYNVKIPMRDGIRLSAAIHRPEGSGPFTCVLSRSCYTQWSATLAERARYWTSVGFALVIQDVRGRGDSDGDFYPLIHEQADGIDTLDWLAAQGWSDGRVVMVGGSYAGWTQLYLAVANHPALKAIAPVAAPPDPDRSFPIGHGILSPAAAAWLATLDGHTNQDLSQCDVRGAYSKLPIIDFDRHIGRHLVAWRDWVMNPPGSDYWRSQRYQQDLLKSRVPILHITGWYDDCLAGAIENFTAMSESATDPGSREKQRMVIGPWMHGTIGQRRIGEVDYGPDAEINMLELQRGWFAAQLDGERDNLPPVRLFIMGRNSWIDEDKWPLPGTIYVPYYFRGEGRANSRLGDGELSVSAPEDEQPDRFRYDPANPVPYSADFDWRQVGGPDDFAEIELRDDILVYTGPVLTEPLLICGPMQVRLFAASSALDTDWTAKVLDVHPDGRAIRLNDGEIRARFRHGNEEEFLTTGIVEEYRIECGSTCIELPAGHHLRVEISSSAFGKGDLNLNGGGAIGREMVPVVAEQTIYHDRVRPSHLLLPIVNR
jgi:putative CocE/NonD family hydrolase